jgi:hypothetical protein
MEVRGLPEQNFRAGAEYDLVVFDRLALQEQAMLAELRQDAGFYGILRPHDGSGRTMRSVDRDTALLWLGAQSPGRLPFFVWDGADQALAARRIVQLVLDGVLEIEHDGAFVSGARALPLLRPPEVARRSGRLRALADQALYYAESLELNDADALAACLYSYGAAPLSPSWTRRFRDGDDVLAYLGATVGTAMYRNLTTHFNRASDSGEIGWLAWSSKSRRAPAPTEPVYKLYVSPLPDELPRVFPDVVDVLSRHDHLQFKVGGNALGVLRPDKLVAYFASEESLQSVADLLATRLSTIAPHGVPFSSEIAGDGLLSWGMDPPRTARALSWQDSDSWRFWVTRRLGLSIVAAQADAVEPGAASRYAVERLRLEGVDVEAWTPANATWWRS